MEVCGGGERSSRVLRVRVGCEKLRGRAWRQRIGLGGARRHATGLSDGFGRRLDLAQSALPFPLATLMRAASRRASPFGPGWSSKNHTNGPSRLRPSRQLPRPTHKRPPQTKPHTQASLFTHPSGTPSPHQGPAVPTASELEFCSKIGDKKLVFKNTISLIQAQS